jgi:hypothetical protein
MFIQCFSRKTIVWRRGNEIVDERARHAALNGVVFERTFQPVDFQGLQRSVLLHTPEGFSSTLV